MIAGLEAPDAGEVSILGADVTGIQPQQRGVGFVFQHYAAFKHMTVRDNVAFGLTIRKRPKDEIRARVDELLSLVQLDGFANRYESALRGPAAAGRRSRGRWPSSPRCSSSTSRSARSTPRCGRSCGAGCAVCTRTST